MIKKPNHKTLKIKVERVQSYYLFRPELFGKKEFRCTTTVEQTEMDEHERDFYSHKNRK